MNDNKNTRVIKLSPSNNNSIPRNNNITKQSVRSLSSHNMNKVISDLASLRRK